jgi:hypothetical protein
LKLRKKKNKSQQKGLERHRNIWVWACPDFRYTCSSNQVSILISSDLCEVKILFCWMILYEFFNMLSCILVCNWLVKYERTCHGWVGRGDWPSWGMRNFSSVYSFDILIHIVLLHLSMS